MNEEWKDIDGYAGSYQVSNLGRVRSLTRRIKSPRGSRVIPGNIRSAKKAQDTRIPNDYSVYQREGEDLLCPQISSDSLSSKPKQQPRG